MRITFGGRELRSVNEARAEYPVLGIAIAMLLIFLSPFLSSLSSYLAFVICLYRIVRYDARVFATDYCMLIPLSALFQTQAGMALIVYVCLVAVVWYIVRNGIRANSVFILLFVLMIYLIARMQMDISNFLLCFGSLCLLYVVLPKQDEDSAERTAKAFCLSVIIASVYALVFRDTTQLRAVLGNEVAAYWGSSVMRFNGLFEDPNYYMVMLVVGLSLLIKLKDCGKIKMLPFIVVGVAFIAFGIMTYSKTFFLALILLIGICIVWQFWNREHLRGLLVMLVLIPTAAMLVLSDNSPFAVVLTRLTSGTTLSDITTGRTDIFDTYFKAIAASPTSFLFGAGLAAGNLGMDTHNLFLEITYYLGVIGLVLFVALFCGLLSVVKRQMDFGKDQNFVAKYVTLFMILVLYCTLHGMFAPVAYASFFLALLSIMLKKKEEN